MGIPQFKAPEILFRPELIGSELPGIHTSLLSSLLKTDLDLRKGLLCNILLSGGTTLTPGFGDRLLLELKKQVPPDFKLKIYAPQDRHVSSWIGGSILGSLVTFKKIWISQHEYQEDPDIVFKKDVLAPRTLISNKASLFIALFADYGLVQVTQDD